MQSYDSMFGYMFIGIGAMCVYYAIRGKGMAYNNHLPQQIKAESDKLLRLFLWILGPVVMAQGYCDVKGITAQYGFLYPLFLGLSVTILVVYFILFRKKFGSALKRDKNKDIEINKPL